MNRDWKERYLAPSQIQTAWFAKLAPAKQHLACDVMNFAFHTRDTIEQAIEGCTDVRRKFKMKEAFRDCQKSGWGQGVSDMQEALVHLRKGVWTDENSSNYYNRAGKPRLYPGTNSIIHTATACVNFLEAVEDTLAKLRTLAEEYQRLVQRLEQESRRPDKNWEQIGKLLSDVKTNAEVAEPFLWSAPRIQSRVGQVKDYAQLLGMLHTAATRVVKLKTLGLSDLQAYGLAAGATVLDLVPILGGLYGAAVDWAIDFIPAWKQFIDSYTRRLDLASRGVML